MGGKMIPMLAATACKAGASSGRARRRGVDDHKRRADVGNRERVPRRPVREAGLGEHIVELDFIFDARDATLRKVRHVGADRALTKDGFRHRQRTNNAWRDCRAAD